MKRLTSDDTKSIFYSLNLFFAKDNEVWIRGGGPEPDYQDCTLVNWIGRVADKHNLEIHARDAVNLDDEMYDCLQDGIDTIEGIVALLHAAAVQAATMKIRLKEIENILGDDYDLDRLKELVEADREGRCMVAKLKIGEHVFVVGKKKIVKARIQEIYFDDMPELIYLVDFECDNSCDGCPFNSWSQSWEGEWECDGEYGDGSVKQSDFGKTVFLTREEAEAALEKMKEGDK